MIDPQIGHKSELILFPWYFYYEKMTLNYHVEVVVVQRKIHADFGNILLMFLDFTWLAGKRRIQHVSGNGIRCCKVAHSV